MKWSTWNLLNKSKTEKKRSLHNRSYNNMYVLCLMLLAVYYTLRHICNAEIINVGLCKSLATCRIHWYFMYCITFLVQTLPINCIHLRMFPDSCEKQETNTHFSKTREMWHHTYCKTALYTFNKLYNCLSSSNWRNATSCLEDLDNHIVI